MTYSYECLSCEEKFTVEKGINEKIEIKCPKCSSNNIKRNFTPINSVWNCSGSYNQTRK